MRGRGLGGGFVGGLGNLLLDLPVDSLDKEADEDVLGLGGTWIRTGYL